jgi:hypothetical protein
MSRNALLYKTKKFGHLSCEEAPLRRILSGFFQDEGRAGIRVLARCIGAGFSA